MHLRPGWAEHAARRGGCGGSEPIAAQRRRAARVVLHLQKEGKQSTQRNAVVSVRPEAHSSARCTSSCICRQGGAEHAARCGGSEPITTHSSARCAPSCTLAQDGQSKKRDVVVVVGQSLSQHSSAARGASSGTWNRRASNALRALVAWPEAHSSARHTSSCACRQGGAEHAARLGVRVRLGQSSSRGTRRQHKQAQQMKHGGWQVAHAHERRRRHCRPGHSTTAARRAASVPSPAARGLRSGDARFGLGWHLMIRLAA